MEATVDAVGRILVPKALRDQLGIRPGSKVDISVYGAGLAVTLGGRTGRVVEEDGRLVIDGDTELTDEMLYGLIDEGATLSEPVGVDTSVAVPLLVRRHRDHGRIVSWLRGRSVVLSGHALAESYSVVTRLPHGLRIEPSEVARVFDSTFGPAAVLDAGTARGLPRILAAADISGGAVYDALVGLAARENGLTLVTRDARARRTYDAIGVDVELVG